MNIVYLLSTCMPLWLVQFPLAVSYPQDIKYMAFYIALVSKIILWVMDMI
jgi:hypothetical protein